MKKDINTVILIFAFNRPYHLNNLLVSLNQNKESKNLPIKIFLDGPRNNKDKCNLKKIVKIIKKNKLNLPNLVIVKRRKNFGSKFNIINGISHSFKKYDSAIILEDDLVLDKYFLKFMLFSLKKFKNKNKVFHISGFSFLNNPNNNGTYFTRYMNCWGWATWADRWIKLNTNSNEIIRSFSKKDIYEFNIENSHDFFRQILENKMGILNTWAIFWYATIFKEKGLCLTPYNSLVKNEGYDGSGERLGKAISQSKLDGTLIKSFPNEIIENSKDLEVLKKYFQKQKNIFKTIIKNMIYLMPKDYQKPITKKLIKARFLLTNFYNKINSI